MITDLPKMIGKVKVSYAPNIVKLEMGTWWFNTSGVHYERAICELSERFDIKGTVLLKGGIISPNYYLLFVEPKKEK